MSMETTNATTRYEQIKANASRFNDRSLAFRAAASCEKARWVVLGDDGKFWVVRPVDAAWMEAHRYEFAA